MRVRLGRFISLVVAVLLFLTGSETTLRAADPEKLMQQVQSLIEQGKYQEALPVAENLLETVRARAGPESFAYGVALVNIGMVQVGLGHARESEEAFRTAVALLERFAKLKDAKQQEILVGARLLYGMLLFQRDQLTEARGQLTKALDTQTQLHGRKNEGTAAALISLGFLALQMGEKDGARQYFQEALQDIPEKAGESNPSAAGAHLGIGLLLLDQGKITEAEGHINPAFELFASYPMFRPFLPRLMLARGMIARWRYDLEGATRFLNQAMAIQDDLFGSNHPDRAVILSELASLEHWQIKRSEEERHRRAALQLTSEAFGPDDSRTLRFERELADMLVSQRKYQEAAGLLAHIRKTEEQRQGLGNTSAETLQLMVQLEEHVGTIRDAIALQSKALNLLRQRSQGDSKDLADAMHKLGTLYLQAGDVDAAGPLLGQAHGMSVRLLPARSPVIVLGLVSLAMLDQSKGDLGHAHLLLRQAQDQLPADPEASRRLGALVNLNIGLTYTKQGNPKAAEHYLAELQAVAEDVFGGDEIILAETTRNLGILLVQRGDYAKAEPNLRRALDIYSRLNPRSADTVRTAMALGVTLLIRGDPASAEGLFGEAIARMDQDRGTLLAALTGGLALTLMERGKVAEAEMQLQRTIEIATQSQEKSYSLAANYLYQLGNFRLRAGDLVQASIFWRRAEETARREVDRNHPTIAYVLEARAQLLAKGTPVEKEQAIKLASEAIQILSERLGGDHPLVAEAWNVKAISEWSASRLSSARASLETEARLEAANFTRQLVFREEVGYQKLLKDQSPTDLYVSFHLLGMPDSEAAARLAFQAALQRKGTLQDVLAEHARLQRQVGEGTQLFERWTEAERKARTCGLSKSPLDVVSFPSGPTGACAKNAISLAVEAGVAYKAIVEKIPGFNAKPVELPDLAARLHGLGDYSLVEIVQFAPIRPSDIGDLPPRYAAYTLSPSGRIGWVDLGPRDRIDELSNEVRKLQSDPNSDLDAAHKAARSLDALVMQPIRAKLGGQKKLFIAADGNLNLIDFSSLIDEDHHELIEHYLIAGLTSGRDLLRLPLEPSSRMAQKDFLFTDPAFLATVSPPSPAAVSEAVQLGGGQTVLTCEDAYLRRDWTEIPFSSERLSKWRASLPGVAAYSGDDANKYALKAIETPRSVWLLTHGFFCSNSSEGDAASLWEDPMQRAALALAGASASSPSARRNGYVTASEISQLHWQGAELVVLGACETALGVPSIGDGVHGLRRALTLAGARSQVMTLWQVSGPQTFDILQRFAEHLASGQDRLSALRSAQLEMHARKPDGIHNYAHPYYWAGIYFMGDPRPIQNR